MSDEEWQRWMATYAKEGRPIPPVMGRARTDRTRALIGLTGVYAIGGAVILAELSELRQDHTTADLAGSLFTAVCALIIIVGVHVNTWGILGRSGGAPLDLLVDLERRHARRRRLLRFLPWITGLTVCGTVAIQVVSMLATGRFDLWAILVAGASCAATIAVVWFFMKRIGAVIDRELRQSVEARRLLAEDDVPSPNKKSP